MKEGWVKKKLSEIATYSIGLTYKPENVSDKGTIVLRSSNIQDSKLDLTDIVRVNVPIKENLFVEKGDILMCSRNGSKRLVGKVAMIEQTGDKMTYGTFMTIIKSQYNPLLYYFFLSDSFRKQLTSSDSPMINQITKYMLANLTVNIPTLSEQQRIVEKLDTGFAKIDQIKANAEKNLQQAKDLFQATLREEFEYREGWTKCKLSEIADYNIGLTYKPDNVKDKGTIVLRSSNIQNSRLDLSDIVRVDVPIKENLYVKDGDILMCSRNGSKRLVGKVAILKNLQDKMTYGTFMTVIRSTYNPLLYYFFLSNSFRKQLISSDNPMINQITKYMLSDLSINIPPINQQQQVVDKLDKLSDICKKLENNYNRILMECDALKQALLRKAFNGEL